MTLECASSACVKKQSFLIPEDYCGDRGNLQDLPSQLTPPLPSMCHLHGYGRNSMEALFCSILMPRKLISVRSCFSRPLFWVGTLRPGLSLGNHYHFVAQAPEEAATLKSLLGGASEEGSFRKGSIDCGIHALDSFGNIRYRHLGVDFTSPQDGSFWEESHHPWFPGLWSSNGNPHGLGMADRFGYLLQLFRLISWRSGLQFVDPILRRSEFSSSSLHHLLDLENSASLCDYFHSFVWISEPAASMGLQRRIEGE